MTQTSPKNAGGTPASSLLVSYRKHLHPDRPRYRSVFPPTAGQARAGTSTNTKRICFKAKSCRRLASVSMYPHCASCVSKLYAGIF
jgi:hypothetical protein